MSLICPLCPPPPFLQVCEVQSQGNDRDLQQLSKGASMKVNEVQTALNLEDYGICVVSFLSFFSFFSLPFFPFLTRSKKKKELIKTTFTAEVTKSLLP